MVHSRKQRPRDDYLSQLASVEVEGRQLDDADYVGLLAAFLGAGHHSTTSAMASLIEDRVGRLDKLVLNGWDDRDLDNNVEWPQECVHTGTGPDGQPMGLGGLQMAERVLSGESGSLA